MARTGLRIARVRRADNRQIEGGTAFQTQVARSREDRLGRAALNLGDTRPKTSGPVGP